VLQRVQFTPTSAEPSHNAQTVHMPEFCLVQGWRVGRMMAKSLVDAERICLQTPSFWPLDSVCGAPSVAAALEADARLPKGDERSAPLP